MSFSKALIAGLVVATQLALAQDERRIVAIGDIHGAYDQFVSILMRADLIDSAQGWTGGRAILVQTGDYTDRGAQVRDVLDLLMKLERSARAGGGQVTTLLGNHEVLNIIGSLRDVTPEICRAFVDKQSDARRDTAFKEYERLAGARARVRATLPPVLRRSKADWMAAHPPGWIEYREALGPRGDYGRWLRTKPIAASVDGTIFMHAGINPDHPATVDEVNTRARTEVERYDAYLQRLVDRRMALPYFTLDEVLAISAAELEAAGAIVQEAKARNAQPDLRAFDLTLLREAAEIGRMSEWSLLAGEGPLWFRGYATWTEDEVAKGKVLGFLDRFGFKRIAVGHTPTKDSRITPRFGGRVFLIDTGMLTSVFKGRPSALDIRGPAVGAIYEDAVVPLAPVSTPPSASLELSVPARSATFLAAGG